MSKKHIGNRVQIIGWILAFAVAIYHIYGFIEIYSDVSTRAYAPLILIEGVFFVSVPLIVVWMGKRAQKNDELLKK